MHEQANAAGNKVANTVETLLAALFLCAIALSFFNVVGRYISGFTYRGGDEVQVFIMVAVTFFGAGVVAWRNQHLRLDLLQALAPTNIRDAIRRFEQCLGLLVCGFVVWIAWSYTVRLFGFGMRSDTAGLPLWIPHSALIVGFGLVCLSYLRLGRQSREKNVQPES